MARYVYFNPYHTLEEGLKAHEKLKRHIQLMTNLSYIGIKIQGVINQDTIDELNDSEEELKISKQWLLDEFAKASPEMQGKILAVVLNEQQMEDS